MNLLVFPLDMDACLPIVTAAHSLGIGLVGASSVMSDMGSWSIDTFARLPFVTDALFDREFQRLIEQFKITHVYTPHEGVWQHLFNLEARPQKTHVFTLCKPDPFSAVWCLHEPHEAWASTAANSQGAQWLAGTQVSEPLSNACYASLHRHFLFTPGQCDDAKLLALCDIFRTLSPGDIVEIGALWGRSAYALGYLAKRHRLGSVICVDPWDADAISDQGASAVLLNNEHLRFDQQKVFRAFLSTAALLDNVGYIRATSEAALPLYIQAMAKGELDCQELGRLKLLPQVSLIHIDGNHRYDHVKRDVELWLPCLRQGGWLLLDDYLWPFGDGPKQVGDAMLHHPGFGRAFVCADTLFLQKI